jgi:hypothetical protein
MALGVTTHDPREGEPPPAVAGLDVKPLPGFWIEKLAMCPPLLNTAVPLNPDPPLRVIPVTVVFLGGVLVQCALGFQPIMQSGVVESVAVALAPTPPGPLMVTGGGVL